MSIQTLPPATVRIIGASQVLTDPTSVVKELVDNALDARAASIFVEISSNTLDIIQVRDNGHGIAPDDRELVCRRYCTSKIRDYSDLKDVGGKWLGFRGEALASAAELGGTLIVTTRIEGEAVAEALKIKTNGELQGRDRASHPVGTTVRLTDLFSPIPVRKQTALKQSSKTLSKTKRMLQSYALARPSVRFSLRILKAKNDKGNWTYAPQADAGIEDAAFKVIGKECASQCEWMVVEVNDFEVQAFLPKTSADSSKISNIGHFVSIDSRPVSTVRGTMKQMMTSFKEKLRASNPNMASVRDIFIWLNIKCPPRSYDPNIEPAKDDVMFEDKIKVLEAVEALFDQCYPPVASKNCDPVSTGVIEIFEDPVEDEIERPAKRQRQDLSNMYGGNDEGDDLLNMPDFPHNVEDEDAESSTELRNMSLSNPWIMAKMNTSVRSRRTGSSRNGQLLTPLKERNSSDANSVSRAEPVHFPPHPPWNLPSPQASSPLRSTSPAFVLPTAVDEATDSTATSHYVEPVHVAETSQPSIGVLQDQLPSNPQPSRSRYTGWRAINDFVPAGQLSLDHLTEPPLETSTRQFRPVKRQQYLRAAEAAAAGIRKPFVSPVRDESNVWSDHLPSSSSPPKRNPGRRRQQGHPQDLDIRDAFAMAAPPTGPVPEAPPMRPRRQRRENTGAAAEIYEDDMDVGMDAATLHRHRRLENADLNPRIREFVHPSESSLPEPTALAPAHDHPNPEAQYPDLTITQPQNQPTISSNPSRKLSRHASRTAHLPLERVPHGAQLQHLRLKLSSSVDVLMDLTVELQVREHECEDIRAPVWGFAAGDADADGNGDADGGSRGNEEEGDLGEDEACGRSSLTFPIPTPHEFAGWKAQLECFAREKGVVLPFH